MTSLSEADTLRDGKREPAGGRGCTRYSLSNTLGRSPSAFAPGDPGQLDLVQNKKNWSPACLEKNCRISSSGDICRAHRNH